MPENVMKETPLSPQAKKEVIEVLSNVCHCFRKATLNNGHAWAMDHDDDAIHKVAAAEFMRSRIQKIVDAVKENRDG